MSKLPDYISEVGAVRIREGIEVDLTIVDENGNQQQFTLSEPYKSTEHKDQLVAAVIRPETQDPDQAPEEIVLPRDKRIHRYRTIALATAAGAVVMAGVVTGIRVLHKRDLS